MSNKLLIKSKCLKDFLSLFDGDCCIESLSLGDTWHPSSGFVDENILDGKREIKDILGFRYEFEGLISFEAKIGSVAVRLMAYPNEDRELEEYQVRGSEEDLRSIYIKIVEENACCRGKYQVCFLNEWE